MHAFACRLLPVVLVAGSAGAFIKDRKPQFPFPFGMTMRLPDSLRGTVYELAPLTPRLPDLTRLQPVGFLYTHSLNVPTRLYTEGIPGVTDRVEWFAIDYEGDFQIDKPGRYRFDLTSDDGAKLYIDGNLIVDNDGIHETLSLRGSVVLSSGIHHLHVPYFQGPRDRVALVLEIAPPSEDFRVFDVRDFKPHRSARQAASAENEEVRPHLRVDPAFRGSAALTGYELIAFKELNAQPRPHAFDFLSAALRFPAERENSQYAITFEIPAASITVTPDASGRDNTLHLLLLALVRDESGQVVKKASEDFRTSITAERLADLRANTLTWTRTVTLPPGRFTVEGVVVDGEGNRSSANTIEIDNPARQGIGLSGVALVQRLEPAGSQQEPDPLCFGGNRLVPELAATLPASARPSVYFVVYPDLSKPDKPKIEVEFLEGGLAIAKQTADLPAPDATGAIPMTIAAIPQPGSYELKITARQGADSVEQTIQYSIGGNTR
jgi:hypothetical protein